MNPSGIEQPYNPVFQPGHHENLSDLDAGDWDLFGDASMSGRFPGSRQKTLYRSGREQPAVYCALSFRLTIPMLAIFLTAPKALPNKPEIRIIG